MPRMKDIDIDFISLVNKGANKQTVKIYKSDKEPVNSNEEEFRGFFNVIKSFFNKDKQQVKKSEYITDFNTLVGEAVMEQRIRDARWALMDSLENTLLDSTVTDKATHMANQIDAFKAYIINTVNTVGIQKSLEQMQEIKKSKEDEDMKPEDIKKMLDDALNPIRNEIKVLKGEEEPPAGDEGTEGEGTETEPTQEEIIAKAIKEVTGPLMDEIAELKKSRRAPQSLDTNVNGVTEVKKSYIGAFEGMFNN
ncbi:Uncharacterised protein [[Clostridium] sordellii]|uniref:hypothetical protein n=1 Tax=Paraclostridium sordellii TaxID=1505 RepID=UPI0005E13D88|nr:hypothetical protein [Paeniclostridium sordellii]CEN84179.1 Uncharacterised protein [[Clostridium] sordellii] [Paeniclostridium sordellii]CEO09624.1 Uncharacterised protein [[Clostridium] sordellii] [Paeniclostridium sordellii]